MHAYLPAIGFGQIKKKSQLQQLLNSVQKLPDKVQKLKIDDESSLVLMTKEIAPNVGIMICGEEDIDENFQMEYYSPYISSVNCSTEAECSIERKSSREAYDGICDDLRLGLNLIFSLNNFFEYKKYKEIHEYYPTVTGVCLSALCNEGKILLPIQKKAELVRAAKKKEEGRQKLLLEARKGSQEAIDNLTLEDINLGNMVSRLAVSCDLYTLVESSIMPCGIECDRYTVLGEIVNVSQLTNEMSKEMLYQMDVECNGVRICILVNKDGLLGEPKVGRRFKGDIWLQGKANFV